MRSVFIACLRGYQRFISPLLGPNCRFHPTCSQYAIDAIRTHGICRGVGFALWRIVRCNPFCAGGYDPVPARKSPSH